MSAKLSRNECKTVNFPSNSNPEHDGVNGGFLQKTED